MPLTLNDINEIRRGIKIDGRNINDLEALLMHWDDITALFREANTKYGVASKDLDGNIKMMGIKIIESHHIQSGSVFKIWKTDKPNIYPDQQYDYVPQPFETYEMAKPLFPPTKVQYKEIDHSKGAVVAEKKNEKKRHSLTRKIELGQPEK